MNRLLSRKTKSYRLPCKQKHSDALETYLQKYPEAKRRGELLSKIAALKRSELTEWTLYEVANQHLPQYIQLSSIQYFEDRAAVRVKMLVDPSAPKVFLWEIFSRRCPYRTIKCLRLHKAGHGHI